MKAVVKGISNLIKWLPVIWNDRDWDYVYLLKILAFKLKNMEDYMGGDDVMTVGAKKTSKQIKIARILSERLANEDSYLENAMYWHDKKYGLCRSNFFEDFFQGDPNDKCKTYVGDPNKNRGESFTKCCIHSDYMRKQDKEYLFNHMKKYITQWWD